MVSTFFISSAVKDKNEIDEVDTTILYTANASVDMNMKYEFVINVGKKRKKIKSINIKECSKFLKLLLFC